MFSFVTLFRVIAVLGLLGVLIARPLRAASTELTWQKSVAPLLEASCGSCHSEKTKTSGFSVGNAAAVIAGGNKHGKAVVEGHPEQSPLIRILKGELAPKMPIGKSLGETEIARIAEWIRELPPSNTAKSTEWRWPFEKPVKRDPPSLA